MADAENRIDFMVGDSDLYFLGVAAALAARWHLLRKQGGMRGYQGFPQSDQDAIRLVGRGLAVGAAMPADDVPELFVSVHVERDVLARLGEEQGEDYEEGWDEEEGEDYEEG